MKISKEVLEKLSKKDLIKIIMEAEDKAPEIIYLQPTPSLPSPSFPQEPYYPNYPSYPITTCLSDE